MTLTKIKSLRESLGMTQEQFSIALGVRRATVSDWENGKSPPSRMAIKLMESLKARSV